MTPKGGVTPHTKFRIAAKKAEVLFTDYIAEHLSADGRGGVIVPNGIVATTQNAYVKLRRFLVEDSLVAVVSLPAGVFKPYSGVKTSILLLDKKLARQTKEILFLKITADGFDLGDKRNPITANDLPEAGRAVKAWLKGKLNGESRTTNGGGMAWGTVEKNSLLEHRACSLQTEQFLGNGAVSEEIETVRLGDVCVKCQQANPESLGRPAFRYIDIDSVDNIGLRITEPKSLPVGEAPSRARKLVKARDVLFSTVRPYLKNIAIVPASLDGEIASTGFGVMRADEARALPEYLFAVVSNQRFVDAANDLTTGASYPAITENQLFDLEIPLPPLEEQRRIVAEIEGYQKVLDGARQILDALEHQLHIEPDWELVPFCTICENLDGKRRPITKSDRKPGPYPYYGASGMVDSVADYIFDEPLLLVSEDGANLLARSTPIAFSVSGKIWVNNHAHVVRFPDMATQRFVEHYLNSISIANYVTGAAQPKLNQAQLNSIEIPLPPLSEQRRLVAELDAETAQMDAVRSLLPRFEAKIKRVLDRVWGEPEL